MYKSEIERGKMSSINKYNNFGLREKGNELWVSMLIELGENFFPWHVGHALGHPKVDAASAWFKQALLINDNHKPTALLDVFRGKGAASSLGWELIWIALANNAMMVKWFVTNTEMDKPYTIEKLSQMLDDMYPSLGKTTIKGGLAALKDMLTKSPLGGEGAVTLLSMKGKSVQDITHKSKDVNSLTILYGLYLIAVKAERGSFTVRELLTADEESVMEDGFVNVVGVKVEGDAGIILLGNIDVNDMEATRDMFRELPAVFRDAALIERIHGFILGRKIPPLTDAMLINNWALNTEYFTEIMHLMRTPAETMRYRGLVEQLVQTRRGVDKREKEAVLRLCTAYLKLFFRMQTGI